MRAPPAGRAPVPASLKGHLDELPSDRLLLVGMEPEALDVPALRVVPLDPSTDLSTAQLDDRFAAIVATAVVLDAAAARDGDGGRLVLHNVASNLLPGGLLLISGSTEVAVHEPARRCGLEAAPDVAGYSAWRRSTRYTVHDLVADARAGLARLGPRDLALALAREDTVTVLDTRTDTDRARTGSIPGAIHTPRTVLEWMADPAAGFAHPAIVSFEQRLVVVCNSGYSSSLAAANLQRLGFVNATDLTGGMAAWVAAGLPVVEPDHAHHDPYVPTRATIEAQQP